MVETLAVGVLEGHLAVAIGESVAGEAAGAGSISEVAGLAEGVEGVALGQGLVVKVAGVAGDAHAAFVEVPAEGVLLFALDDAVGAADHVPWETAGAGSRGGQVVFAERADWDALTVGAEVESA